MLKPIFRSALPPPASQCAVVHGSGTHNRSAICIGTCSCVSCFLLCVIALSTPVIPPAYLPTACPPPARDPVAEAQNLGQGIRPERSTISACNVAEYKIGDYNGLAVPHKHYTCGTFHEGRRWAACVRQVTPPPILQEPKKRATIEGTTIEGPPHPGTPQDGARTTCHATFVCTFQHSFVSLPHPGQQGLSNACLTDVAWGWGTSLSDSLWETWPHEQGG